MTSADIMTALQPIWTRKHVTAKPAPTSPPLSITVYSMVWSLTAVGLQRAHESLC